MICDGVPKFKLDLWPGSDMVGETMSGPLAAKEMELILLVVWQCK
jgi:hypothetical protein